MSNKKNRIFFDVGYFQGEPLTKRMKERFRWFVRVKKNKKDLLKNAERINWNKLGNFCLNQINELVKTSHIPECFVSTDSNNWYTKVYSKTILQFLEYELFNTLSDLLDQIDEATNESRKKLITIKAVNQSKSKVRNIIYVLKYQAEVSAMRWNQDSETIKSEMKKLEKYADVGKKFYGKQFLNVEVEAFEKIKQKFIQVQKDGLNLSYRSIAFQIAHDELGYDQQSEKILFYKRFLRYLKKDK